jgi:hypothetical protein
MPVLVTSILASLPALANVAALCTFIFIVFGTLSSYHP